MENSQLEVVCPSPQVSELSQLHINFVTSSTNSGVNSSSEKEFGARLASEQNYEGFQRNCESKTQG